MATPGPQRNLMDKLLEILNSMRSNSSGVEAQLASFMEEAQGSPQSEETLSEIAHTIYSKAVRDRGFAATAAKLCYKMALFMVEGTKFRSLLLNMLQVWSAFRKWCIVDYFPSFCSVHLSTTTRSGVMVWTCLTPGGEAERQSVPGERVCGGEDDCAVHTYAMCFG